MLPGQRKEKIVFTTAILEEKNVHLFQGMFDTIIIFTSSTF